MRQLLCEVLNLCFRISNESVADVFFDYVPHCNYYNVYWWRDGWGIEKDMVWLEMTAEITEGNLYATICKLCDIATEMGVRL